MEIFTDFFIPLVKEKNILDFGCGTGKFILSLGAVSKNYTGIDIEKGQLEIASKKAKKYKHVNVLKYSGDKIPLETNSIASSSSIFGK